MTTALATITQPKLTREYIGSTMFMSRVLPWAADDLTRVLGDDIYERMLRDAQVGANIRVYKAATLRDGCTLTSAIQDKTQDGYQLAADLTDLFEQQLDDMETSLDDTLWSLLDAVATGCAVAEEVYALDRSYTGRTQYVLRRLAPKPRRDVALVTNAFNEVIGLRGRIVSTANDTAGTSYEILDRSKFVVFTFQPPDGDPRGSSLLRQAYTPWDVKQRLWPEYYKYLVQFASPSVVGIAAENAPNVLDQNGNEITAVESLLNALLSYQNGTALALPHGADAKVIFSQGDGKAFLDAFGHVDRQITTAILAQTRTTMEAQHGSKADSETSRDVFDTFVQATRRALARVIRRDVLMDLAVWNYGPDARRLAPILSLGETEQTDLTPLMNAVAALERVGYLDPSQLPDLDIQLGLAARTPEEMKRREDKASTPPPVAPAMQPAQQQQQPDGTPPANATQQEGQPPA